MCAILLLLLLLYMGIRMIPRVPDWYKPEKGPRIPGTINTCLIQGSEYLDLDHHRYGNWMEML